MLVLKAAFLRRILRASGSGQGVTPSRPFLWQLSRGVFFLGLVFKVLLVTQKRCSDSFLPARLWFKFFIYFVLRVFMKTVK